MQISSASSAQALEMAKQLREKMFARADKDGSGGLNLEEFSAVGPGKSGSASASATGSTAATSKAAEIFSKLDADGDGSLTSTELEAGRPSKPPEGAFSSGSMSALLSGQETSGSTASSDLFASLDTDGDGSLTTAEFQAGSAAGRPERAGGPGGAGGPPPGGPPPGGPPPGGASGEGSDQSSLASLLSTSSDSTDGSTSASQSDALAALVKKALENYLKSGASQNSASALASI